MPYSPKYLVLIPGAIVVGLFVAFFFLVGALAPYLSGALSFGIALLLVVGSAATVVLLMRGDRKRRREYTREHSEEGAYHHH